MKKLISLFLVLLLSVTLVACSDNNENVDGSPQTFNVTKSGFGGDVNIDVTIDGETITDVKVVSHSETNVVSDRAFSMIIERIKEANTPVVDCVTGATFTSYAVKAGVADAMTQAGLTVEEIKFTTNGPEHEATTLEDVNTDIVVVGGGPAGLSAAISAKQTNAKANIILVEKLDILSGNGKFDMNFYDLFNSKGQADNGREVTIDDFYASKVKSGENEERLKVWAETTQGMDAWLRDMNINLNHPYGGEKSMSHLAESNQYAGEVIQAGLEKEAYELGIDIRTGTAGKTLVLDGDKVTGVTVTNNDNETYNINAQSVILATGGFSNNKDLLKKYAPGSEVYQTSNQYGTTGDFIPQFEELNYSLVNMDMSRIYPTILSKNRNLTSGADISFVVDANGEKAKSTDNTQQFYITDEIGINSFYRMQKHLDAGYYTTYDSIEELSNDLGIDVDGLQANIDSHNEAVTSGKEGYETKRLFSTEGPYYGAKVEPAIHMTKGGVETNKHAQVLTADGNVVEGLYGAGEVTWQSGGYSQSVAFGIVAGTEAATQLTTK